MIAMGFKYYGFGMEAARIAHDISKAASHFLLNQLPELYTAFQRDETNFPVQYIGANVPQAWAAGSAFMLTQAMLGFLPDAPLSQPVLVEEPILVAPLFPFRKVIGFEVAGRVTQALDDFGIRKTVEHHFI